MQPSQSGVLLTRKWDWADIAASAVETQFNSRGWFIMLEVSGLLFVVLYLALSRFGNIRLGPDTAEPEFSTTAWIAMFCSPQEWDFGLLFYGATEPLTHYEVLRQGTNSDSEAASYAMFVTYLNWGFHAWAILRNRRLGHRLFRLSPNIAPCC